MPTNGARRALDENASVEDVFIAEARDRMDEVARILGGAFPRPGTPELSTLHRHAHSLKGSAGALGQPRVEALAKSISERIAPFEHDAPEVPPEEREHLERDFRALEEEVARIEAARKGG